MRVLSTSQLSQSYFSNSLDAKSADVVETPLLASSSDQYGKVTEVSQLSANERAMQPTNKLGSASPPVSGRDLREDALLPVKGTHDYPVRVDEIPLADMGKSIDRRPYSLYDDSTNEGEEEPSKTADRKKTVVPAEDNHTDNTNCSRTNAEAHRLVRAMTNRLKLDKVWANDPDREDLRSGHTPPAHERHQQDYIPRPTEFKPSILSMLLKVHDQHSAGVVINRHSASDPFNTEHHDARPWRRRSGAKLRSSSPSTAVTPGASPPSSEVSTPQTSGKSTPRRRKWYDKPSGSASTTSLSGLLDASMVLGAPAASKAAPGAHKRTASRPHLTRPRTTGILSSAMHKLTPKHKNPNEILITPQRISFDDSDLHTTEVKLVKADPGVDLGKFRDTFDIYKQVVRDLIGVEEAMQRLDEVNKRPEKFNVWIKILMYGLASAFVGPFAFSARPIDMPIAFVLGCVLGLLQLWVATRSELYSNVFEITASIVTSFAARGMGSIRYKDGTYIFCFSALAQSSIALIFVVVSNSNLATSSQDLCEWSTLSFMPLCSGSESPSALRFMA
ncbi:hypothetical protein GJ744_003491 [Endocarpon pusillum]|uniref:Threonine/serine exporter-like N-terminal domain-containing protein n=1 Tax=Endocarpon pusillum TaxID=364733 RepID=A0A8H7AV93_9EURO|nr:hypothetical protein GJ744_003491 [Endocarpon pusillum]